MGGSVCKGGIQLLLGLRACKRHGSHQVAFERIHWVGMGGAIEGLQEGYTRVRGAMER